MVGMKRAREVASQVFFNPLLGVLFAVTLSSCGGRQVDLQAHPPSENERGVSPAKDVRSNSFHEITETLSDGTKVSMGDFRGKVVLITNVSLKCGTTPQLGDLELLNKKYADQGLIVAGFPSNAITGEPMNDPIAVRTACKNRFGVTFPIFSPGPIRGAEKRPLYAFLTEGGPPETQGEVAFNFEKFLVDRKGNVRFRFGSFTGPESQRMNRAILELLKEEA